MSGGILLVEMLFFWSLFVLILVLIAHCFINGGFPMTLLVDIVLSDRRLLIPRRNYHKFHPLQLGAFTNFAAP